MHQILMDSMTNVILEQGFIHYNEKMKHQLSSSGQFKLRDSDTTKFSGKKKGIGDKWEDYNVIQFLNNEGQRVVRGQTKKPANVIIDRIIQQ